MQLTHILEPIKINQLEIRNRIFRPGHGTYYGKGAVNDTLIAYHEARARAGVGLSILEACSVHPSSFTATLQGWDDSIIGGFRRISDAVHRHGMKLFTQVWHGGHHWPPADGTPGWSASDIPSPYGHIPMAMSRDQIEEIVEAFAATARRAQEGGLDGVELHYGHGYLQPQFFSPVTNVREDEYGGSFENRIRFGFECLRAVRKAVGPDFVVGMRISDQVTPGGLTAQECADIVRAYCTDGLLDFVNGSMGSYHDVHHTVPAMDMPTGVMLPSSGPIVAAAPPGVVRMVVGRYRTIEDADQLLREGTADMVGMNRAMIADADLVAKSINGKADQVRPCIGCNQGCVGGIAGPEQRIFCTVNPTVGMEETLGEHLIVKTDRPQKVVVIGGGPAGMEAARVAALTGHHVTLFEAQSRLGGAVNIARKAPRSAQIADITVWLEQEIYRLGVDVRLSSYVEQGEVLAEEPEAVIVATGAMPRMNGAQAMLPGQPTRGIDQPHVYSSYDIYDVPPESLGRFAVIFDDVGHYEAIGIAEHLIEQGLAVTFVTRHSAMSPHVDGVIRLTPVLKRLRKGDFSLMVRARLVEVDQGSCTVGWLEGEQTAIVPADTVVLVGYNGADQRLYRDLGGGNKGGRAFSLKIVGDAACSRDLLVAIREGHMAGRFIPSVTALQSA